MTATDQRACRLYRFVVWDPRTNYTTKRLGYIGETVRMPFERMMEHVYNQPWADTIVSYEIDDTVYAGKAAVLAAEKAAVEAELPLYNVEYNMRNPDRIKPWEAQRQAAERGRTGLPNARTPRRAPARKATPTARRRPVKRSDPAPPRWFGSLLATVVVWVGLVAAVWTVRAEDWPGWDGPKNSAGVATGLVVGVWFLARPKRKRARRSGRRR